jgi:hypothetical protein
MDRVNWDDLKLEDDNTYSYQGLPFTGWATESFPDGRLRGETPIVDGVEKGVARDWHENGQLKLEEGRLGGGLHGVARLWDPDGQLRREARGEFGIRIASREWDRQGNLVNEYELQPAGGNYQELMLKRRMLPNDIVWKEWPGKSVWESAMHYPYPTPRPAEPPAESHPGSPS